MKVNAQQERNRKKNFTFPKAKKEVNVEDVLQYFTQIKMEFRDKPHIYHCDFLDIMKDYKPETISLLPSVIARVKQLFMGHNELILNFNTLLPEGNKMELTPEEYEYGQNAANNRRQRNAVSYQGYKAPVTSAMEQPHALRYLEKIRNEFASEPERYQSFLDILDNHQKVDNGIKHVLQDVSELLADRLDLVMEFTDCLPHCVRHHAKGVVMATMKKAEEAEASRRLAIAATSLDKITNPTACCCSCHDKKQTTADSTAQQQPANNVTGVKNKRKRSD